ncbi:hypothetical protein BH09ACT7_BH09ACT7_36940 [soil metagenome]
MAVDWSIRGEYIAKRAMTPAIASEALADPDAQVLNPDPASKSGVSVRTIGYSATVGALITAITVEEDGVVCGTNAWRSNDRDIGRYNDRQV